GVRPIGIAGEINGLFRGDDQAAHTGSIAGGGAQTRQGQEENRQFTHFVANHSRSGSSMETSEPTQLAGGPAKMTLLFVFVLGVFGAYAQSTHTATLSGAVIDPTQALVPEAKITVTRADPGITRAT